MGRVNVGVSLETRALAREMVRLECRIRRAIAIRDIVQAYALRKVRDEVRERRSRLMRQEWLRRRGVQAA
jgi:hypothetical protein